MSELLPFGGLGTAATQDETPVKKKRPSKIDLMPLDDLYEHVASTGKATPSVRKAIIAKDTFDAINPRYCKALCGLCKSSQRPSTAQIHTSPVDVLVVQDFLAPDDRWKSGDQMESIYRGILNSLAVKYFQGLTFQVASAVKCRPGPDDLKSNTVSISKARPCSAYLMREIELTKPKAIVVLGTNALKVMGLTMSSTSNRGEIHMWGGVPVIITLHPKVTTMIRQTASGKMWGPDYLEVIDRDFHKAARLARGEFTVRDLDEAIEAAKEHIWVTESLEEVQEACDLIRSLPDSQVISYDLEGTSLDPWSSDARILTAQFGFRDGSNYRAIVIPLWHRDNHFYDADEAWPFLVPILLGQSPKVGHNLKFDILYTAVTRGVRLVNACFDTMLLLHALNSGLKGNYGLKRAVWDWMPESGLGGYEDKLPKLTKLKPGDDEDLEEEDSVD